MGELMRHPVQAACGTCCRPDNLLLSLDEFNWSQHLRIPNICTHSPRQFQRPWTEVYAAHSPSSG